ncbi:MAG: outer membrane beta-barrel protein [Tannerella sp.]|nr:outer membrane beta-barrel protein [Tannerella sp.]
MRRLALLTICMFVFVTAGFAQDWRKTRSTNIVQSGINKYRGEMGVSSVGGIVGYAIDNKTALAGIDYRYNIRDRIRLAPSVLYVLENEYKSVLYANADAHYLARVTDKITIYPIGGLGMSVWNFRVPETNDPETNDLETNDPETTDPETADPGETDPGETDTETSDSETKIRIGLNLGFGGEMRVTKDIIIGAEFRYNLTSERIYDQAMLVARVAYYF